MAAGSGATKPLNPLAVGPMRKALLGVDALGEHGTICKWADTLDGLDEASAQEWDEHQVHAIQAAVKNAVPSAHNGFVFAQIRTPRSPGRSWDSMPLLRAG